MATSTTQKLPTPKQRAAARNLTEALTRYLDTRAVSIVGSVDGRPNEIGSGTCIQLGGHYFIATAAHVIESYPSERLFLVAQNASQVGTVPILGRGKRNDVDVAWLEISPTDAHDVPRDFATLEQLQPHCADVGEDLAILYGSPRDRVQVLSEHELEIAPVGFVTGAPNAPALPNDVDESAHLFLAYPREARTDVHGNAVEAVEAQGFSGGGVWLSHVNDRGVWSPESARLVAIQTSWMPWRWLRCTQIQLWLGMVAEDHEDLRPTLAVSLDLDRWSTR